MIYQLLVTKFYYRFVKNVEYLWNYRFFSWIWTLSIIDPPKNYQINKVII
ncbi:unnamed protein product [Paramecium octaurelia]|uniref:Uncharacterized protein n=1 Tax=Paramecium octaurelia TaxID=43137 RepID=A0A8S1VBN4_PAROT|nr:unnamed protein product [Paramecium octaurelia]